MKIRKYLLGGLCFVLITSGLFSCKKKDQPLEKSVTLSVDSIAAKYYEQYLKLHPLEATAQGDNRYNDQLLIDIDKDYIKQEIAFYRSVQEELKNVDYAALSDEKKIVYDVLDYTLKSKIEGYAFHPEYMPFNQMEGLPVSFPVMGSGQGTQPFHTAKDYENWLKRMEKFPAWTAQAIENFKEGISNKMVLPKQLVIRMIAQMKARELSSKDPRENIFYGPVHHFPETFTTLQREDFSEKYQNAIEKYMIPSYEKLASFLEHEYLPKARNTDGYNGLPNGAEIYKYYVKTWTTTGKTPVEIHSLGLEQVAMLRAEMAKVQAELGYKGTLEQFIQEVKKDPKAMPYRNATQVLDAFQAVLVKIEPGLKHLFHKVPKTPFEIRETEKFREATASAEYIPGTPDGKRPGIFYIPLPHPEKFNITSGMESLFLHEAIPGHHYQISLQQENTRLPKFMRFGWFGAYGEGWAHYCETLGPELGLYKNPYQRMGYLSDQMLRAVRLVVDTGIHTGEMSREQAIEYFLSNIAYDEAGATAEVERYMAMPGQALSYKMGSLEILKLRKKYQEKLGSRFNIASFHDEILSQGCLPLDILDRKMEMWAKHQ